ncbi:MAG TPA: TIGR03067 domain-containing protein, partial [Isosphaeraceae bacterium]
MPTRPIAALLVAACLAALPAHARAQAVSGDLAKIQGKWWTRMYPLGGGRGIVQFIEIRGDAITGTNEDPGSKSVGRVKLDESKSPKAIDYLDTVADTKALKDIKLPDMHGIYETDGETLKIAMNTGILNSKRPTKFTFDYKNGISVTTYRRGEPTPEEAMPKVAAKA